MDPRYYQISVLGGLLIYGLVVLDFEISLPQVAVTMAGVLLTQWACSRLWKLPQFEPRSALISGLSLCLLVRTNSLALAFAAAVVTIASKFLLRWRGKHLFNPTNFGLVVMMLASDDRVWVSPGQWGNVAFFAFLMACLGGLVVMRAARSDVTFAFVACYLGLVFARSFWLEEPVAIPLHRLQSGALLLFTFFMISDSWDMGWCDPCAADPLTNDELRKFGADWLRGKGADRPEEGQIHLTRLHLRYDREHFPEDLVFQETGDKETFQGRYIMRHPWKGKATCPEAKKYFAEQPKAREKEAQNLARLTGWKIETIRERMAEYVDTAKTPKEGK